MIIEVDDGSQTAVVNTEHTLATETEARTYVLVLDMSNMALGDAIEIRAKMKTRSGSTARQVYMESLSGVQSNPVFISLPIPSAHSVAFTLKQTGGTGRAFEWSVISLD